jgi:hypothetical protein
MDVGYNKLDSLGFSPPDKLVFKPRLSLRMSHNLTVPSDEADANAGRCFGNGCSLMSQTALVCATKVWSAILPPIKCFHQHSLFLENTIQE